MSSVDGLIAELKAIASPTEVEKVARFFKGGDPETTVMGAGIGKIFPNAKRFTDLDLDSVEHLLDDTRYEVRMAAMAVLDCKARKKCLPDDQRAALFDLYLRKHDRINNWDLVDRAAPHVIGEYLVGKDRSVLDDLAKSTDPHRRRTAIVATHAFLKRGDVPDTLRIAEALADDSDDYVQIAIASWPREAGKTDTDALIGFLQRNADRPPKTTMTAASKLLPEDLRRRLRRRNKLRE